MVFMLVSFVYFQSEQAGRGVVDVGASGRRPQLAAGMARQGAVVAGGGPTHPGRP